MARIRSPNYPQISLPAALERVRLVYKVERQNRIDRDDALKLMGFGGYNGASAGVLSALLKYGLFEDLGSREMRVSDLAVKIIVPHNDEEKASAIAEAAAKPPLFQELAERWPDNHPSEHSLRTYLTRRGFADSALENVIKSYADTLGLVNALNPQSAFDEENDVSDRKGVQVASEASTSTAPPAPSPTHSIAQSQPVSEGPGMNLVRAKGGYVVYLSGAVLSKEHVDEVVTLLSALKASMPDKAAISEDELEV
ncbi:cell division septation protein DedD [Sphingobium sp. OAS761]|uniref:hypothetical protein n=1 Tax=Sphingobium sp. OAS761 TaxID=2817901 RepID=UPI00209C8E9D|nr:hypothetical protein [Sphingobium sp. OAS761]MCP1468675.1 cell division septation protein DedD [Sphingobium sp. OAS761]